MSEDRCVICGEIVPDGYSLCSNCKELMKDMPVEIEVVLWRPFPLIKPRITSKEYLVATQNGGVDISLWDGFDWISTDDYFSRTDSVIAWTNLPSPYKSKEEDPISDAFKNHHEYVFVLDKEEDKDE